MIKNNKGFVITEVLILSTVIMGVLVFMYTQFKAINRGYQYSFKYDTPQGLYLANNIINYINDGNYDKLVELLNNTPKGYLDITECNIDNSNLISYCNTLFQKSDIEKIIFTKEDLKDIKRNIIDFDNDFKEYIKQISVLNDEADYRIIIKYKNGTFASMRFNKGNAYVQDGLITYLDAVNNTGYGHSDETQIWKDLTNHGNDATLYNNPIWSNNSIIFDGETNFGRIEATANLSYESGITIEARIKILSTEIFNDENEIPFLGNWHGAGLGLLYLEAGTFDSNFYTTNGLKNFNNTETNNINEYTTVTMTHDGTKATLYINGVQKAIINNTNTITPSLAPIGIGGNPKIENTSMDSYANVEFQNVLIYDRALTENEVMRNYQADMAKY
jgi:hypothetical protein